MGCTCILLLHLDQLETLHQDSQGTVEPVKWVMSVNPHIPYSMFSTKQVYSFANTPIEEAKMGGELVLGSLFASFVK